MRMMPKLTPQLNRFLPLLLVTLLGACQGKADSKDWAVLVTPKDKIKVKLAIEESDQRRGFSGTRDDEWPDEDGILFLFPEENYRGFWMPDTYFDLDLFYLDGNFKVIDIQRQLPHFIGREPTERVPRAREVWARHVLELKSKSAIAARIKVGDQFRFQAQWTPPQIK